MEKNGNRPRECPGTPQQARASPICPAGRILFSNENGKLCAAAPEMNFVPHHHLAPSMWHPRYVFRLDDGDNARFLALFDESGKATKAEFIVSALFGREIKVIKLDKGTQDFYMRLTTFHSQFRAIGTNYNQCVRALKSNFSEKKALAFLYRLERHTLELVELSKRISALVEEFRSKYPVR